MALLEAPIMSISTQQREQLIALKDRFVNDGLEVPELGKEAASILQCNEGEKSTWMPFCNWASACEENYRGGDKQPEFPAKIVVVRQKTHESNKPETSQKRGQTAKSGRPAVSKLLATTNDGAPPPRKKARSGDTTGTSKKVQGKQPAKQTAHVRRDTSKVAEVPSDDGVQYNAAIKHTSGGVTKGTAANYPLLEREVKFWAEKDFSHLEGLPLRAATNFRFEDASGRPVSVGPGPAGPDTFLVAVCGSLNPATEGGQRLLAGWWNSDPDPERAKLKAPAEVLWMKIRVLSVTSDATLFLRDENCPHIAVEGEHGYYIPQCPDPRFADRWLACVKNFDGRPSFEGIELDGPAPFWFHDIFWTDLVDEVARWRKANLAIAPPPRPVLGRKEKQVLTREAYVASARAYLFSVNTDIEAARERLNDLQPRKSTKGRITVRDQNAEKSREIERKTLERLAEDKKEAMQVLEHAEKQLKEARAALSSSQARRKPSQPKLKLPVPPPSPTPSVSPGPSPDTERANLIRQPRSEEPSTTVSAPASVSGDEHNPASSPSPSSPPVVPSDASGSPSTSPKPVVQGAAGPSNATGAAQPEAAGEAQPTTPAAFAPQAARLTATSDIEPDYSQEMELGMDATDDNLASSTRLGMLGGGEFRLG